MKKYKLPIIILLSVVMLTATLLASCATSSHIVKFVVDGKTYKTLAFSGNDFLDMPQDPKKADYIFSGWYFDEGIWHEPLTFTTYQDEELTEDIVVYAKFEYYHIHVYTDQTIAPTCVEAGYVLHTCSCGESYKDNFVEALSHDYKTETAVATCTEGGYVRKTCSVCGDVITVSTQEALGHDYVNDICTRCSQVRIPNDTSVTVKEFVADGNRLTRKVDNYVNSVNFSAIVSVAEGAVWKVFYDIDYITEITDNVWALDIGDNVCYLQVTNGQDVSDYTVVVRRKPMLTVTFDPNGGQPIPGVLIMEGETLQDVPTTTLQGYDFDGWNYDFTQPIVSNVTAVAKWAESTNTAYTVCYYYENVADDGYSLRSTDILTGTTNSEVSFVPEEIEYYVFDETKSTLQGTVAADGSSALSVYYNRCRYTVSNGDTALGTIIGTGVYKYGTNVTVCATAYDHCVVQGWFNGETSISNRAEYTCAIECDLTAKFGLCDEIAVFDVAVSGNGTKYVITGIKDKTVTEIVVPSYIAEIEQGAFAGCNKLQSITLPYVGAKENVTSVLEGRYPLGYIFGREEYEGAIKVSHTSSFFGNPSVTEYYLPQTLTTVTVTGGNVYMGAFQNCATLQTVTLPDSLTEIAQNAFRGCTSLQSIVLPDGITDIGEYAFQGCASLQSISLPNGVTKLGDRIFADCTSLQDVTLPSSLTEIAFNAFANCSALQTLTMPDTLTTLGSGVFDGCTTQFVWGDNPSCTTITSTTFTGYLAESITLPGSITTIQSDAFTGCKNLKSFNYLGTLDNYANIDGLFYISNGVRTPYVCGKRVYTVTFSAKGGEGSTNVYVLDGEILTEFPTVTLAGYYLASWDYDFTQPITDNIWTVASWSIRTDVPYTVETYYQNINDSGFTLDESLTQRLQGTFNTTAKVVNVETPYGFIFDPDHSILEGTIVADGSLTLEVYFTRKNYTVSLEENSLGKIIGADTYRYETEVTLLADTQSSCMFDGWYNGETLVSNKDCYVGALTQDLVAHFRAFASDDESKWIENFNYTKNGDSCVIHSIKDKNTVNIFVPSYVTKIEEGAFSGCNNVINLIVPFLGQYSDQTSSSPDRYPLGWFFGSTEFGLAVPTEQTYPGEMIFAGSTLAQSIRTNTYYIPNNLRKVTVTKDPVWTGAFQNCSSLTDVILPEGMTTLYGSTFFKCSSMKTIYVPSSLTEICEDALENCTGELVWGNNPSLTVLGSKSFNLYLAKTINLPGSLCTIEEGAFGNNVAETVNYLGTINKYIGIDWSVLYSAIPSLQTVYVNGTHPTEVSLVGITKIYPKTFYNWTELMTVSICDSVTEIGADAFYNCSCELSWSSQTGVTTFAQNAFRNYRPNKLVIPTSVRTIEENAFANVSSVNSVNFVGSVDRYVEIAGLGNVPSTTSWLINGSKQQSIVLTDATVIKPYAFYNMSWLKSITICNSVTDIGSFAFSGCGATINWGDNPSVTAFNSCSFHGYLGNTISIHANLKTIDSNAFSQAGVENINFVGSLDAWAQLEIIDDLPAYQTVLINGSKLTSITIDNITKITNKPFRNWTWLKSVTVGFKVTEIAEGAFAGCSSLESLSVPFIGASKVANSIDVRYPLGWFFGKDYYAGSTQTSQEYYTGSTSKATYYGYIPNSLRTVNVTYSQAHYGAFMNCSNLTTITLFPTYTGKIEGKLFYGCSSLIAFVIPEGVSSIGEYAFYGCSATLRWQGANLTTLGTNSFAGYSGYILSLPKSLKTISSGAFNSCATEYIVFEGTPSAWDKVTGKNYLPAGAIIQVY